MPVEATPSYEDINLLFDALEKAMIRQNKELGVDVISFHWQGLYTDGYEFVAIKKGHIYYGEDE
jgi:hypothetical protein